MNTCGTCTLCCELLPVKELDKVRGRCQYQGFGCCTIYPNRPGSCALWSCQYLLGEDLPRPDQCHYVVDVMRDYITAEEGKFRIPVIQVWVDPKYPDAYQDAKLRKYIVRQKDCAALIRYNEHDAFVLFPPSMTGEWREHRGCQSEAQHFI